VYKANNYAKSLGAIGGRLLTYGEVYNLKDSYSDIIYVTYGASKYYWLGSAGSGYRRVERGWLWRLGHRRLRPQQLLRGSPSYRNLQI